MASSKSKAIEPVVEVPAMDSAPAVVEEKPVVVEKPIPKVKPAPESIYTAAELAENFKAFHTSREIVTVALRLAGIRTATFAEAKNIIEKFKNKEVN